MIPTRTGNRGASSAHAHAPGVRRPAGEWLSSSVVFATRRARRRETDRAGKRLRRDHLVMKRQRPEDETGSSAPVGPRGCLTSSRDDVRTRGESEVGHPPATKASPSCVTSTGWAPPHLGGSARFRTSSGAESTRITSPACGQRVTNEPGKGLRQRPDTRSDRPLQVLVTEPEWLRDPAVTRGLAGSTPVGHPIANAGNNLARRVLYMMDAPQRTRLWPVETRVGSERLGAAALPSRERRSDDGPSGQ